MEKTINDVTNECFNYLRLGYLIGRHEATIGDVAPVKMFTELYTQIDTDNPSMEDIRIACNEADAETIDKNVYFKSGYLVGRDEASTGDAIPLEELTSLHKEIVEINPSLDSLREGCNMAYCEDEEDIDSIVDNTHFLTGYKVGATEAITKSESAAREIIDTYHPTGDIDDLTIEKLREYYHKIQNGGCGCCDNEDCACKCHSDEDNAEDFYCLSALPEIDHVLFSGKATIIFWADGKKTVVKCQRGDKYSQEEGLAMGICKRAYGNDNTFNDVINAAMKNAKVVDGKKSDSKKK